MENRFETHMQWRRDTVTTQLAGLGVALTCILGAPADASAQTIVPGTLRLPGDSAARADSISRAAGADSAGRTASRDSAGTGSGVSSGAGTAGTGTIGSGTGVYISPSTGTLG